MDLVNQSISCLVIQSVAYLVDHLMSWLVGWLVG
jgi:hypothetical protein